MQLKLDRPCVAIDPVSISSGALGPSHQIGFLSVISWENCLRPGELPEWEIYPRPAVSHFINWKLFLLVLAVACTLQRQ